MDDLKLEKFPGPSRPISRSRPSSRSRSSPGRMKPGQKLPAGARPGRGAPHRAGHGQEGLRGARPAPPHRGRARPRQLRRSGAATSPDREPQGQGPAPDRRAHRRAGPPQVQRPRHPHLLRPPPPRARGRAPEPRTWPPSTAIPRALAIYRAPVPDHPPVVNMAKFLVDDLLEDPSGAERLQSFDLILTTTTHFEEVLERFPELKTKLVQVAMAPTRDSIIRPGPTDAVAEDRRRLRIAALPGDRHSTTSRPSTSRLGRRPALLVRESSRLDAFIAGPGRGHRPGRLFPAADRRSTWPPSRSSPSAAGSSSPSTTRSSGAPSQRGGAPAGRSSTKASGGL
ncbi:MAG: hypothetical protein MZW92_03510 [Comamonadaceae bacterium]|nr:hypothetical protein [Comamonadaceae bacterium]